MKYVTSVHNCTSEWWVWRSRTSIFTNVTLHGSDTQHVVLNHTNKGRTFIDHENPGILAAALLGHFASHQRIRNSWSYETKIPRPRILIYALSVCVAQGQPGKPEGSICRACAVNLNCALGATHFADVYRFADSARADRRLRSTRPRLLLHLPQTHQPDAHVQRSRDFRCRSGRRMRRRHDDGDVECRVGQHASHAVPEVVTSRPTATWDIEQRQYDVITRRLYDIITPAEWRQQATAECWYAPTVTATVLSWVGINRWSPYRIIT